MVSCICEVIFRKELDKKDGRKLVDNNQTIILLILSVKLQTGRVCLLRCPVDDAKFFDSVLTVQSIKKRKEEFHGRRKRNSRAAHCLSGNLL